MLEQMGWQEGKGLGSKEDGGTKHVQIPKKQDNAGYNMYVLYFVLWASDFK